MEERRPWKIEARGKVFEPGEKTMIPPLSISYKKRIYSKNRILHPMKRVDWDPNGERNPQNRGKSKYVQISWDEATQLIADEIKRVHDTYGPLAILCQADGHGETKVVHAPHGAQANLLDLCGGYTLQSRQPDSWEGWYWGGKHIWGNEPVGMQVNQRNLFKDVAEHGDAVLYWGCDLETTPWGWGGEQPSRMAYFLEEVGLRSFFISPDLNYTGAAHKGKWIPVLPNTDAALQLAIAYVWLTEGTLLTGFTSKAIRLVLTGSSDTFLEERTAFPRRPSGQRANAVCRAIRSRRSPAIGRSTPCRLPMPMAAA